YLCSKTLTPFFALFSLSSHRCSRGEALHFGTETSDLEDQSLKGTSLGQKEAEKYQQHSGNISLDEIINIAQQMRHPSLARDLSGTIKEILGTAQSLGYNTDGRHPHDVIDDIKWCCRMSSKFKIQRRLLQ
uniref:Large ribosomal subunit protein uL11 C-terminal domain-containing protein n=1 Tax=Sarcophilus harrisii TaxID=9305 RepID=A0A7N4UY91_SARHA